MKLKKNNDLLLSLLIQLFFNRAFILLVTSSMIILKNLYLAEAYFKYLFVNTQVKGIPVSHSQQKSA
jgi:hypothetical protein